MLIDWVVLIIYSPGPLKTGVPEYTVSTDSRVINTTTELTEFPFNQDYNGVSGNTLGVGTHVLYCPRIAYLMIILTQVGLNSQYVLIDTGSPPGKVLTCYRLPTANVKAQHWDTLIPS